MGGFLRSNCQTQPDKIYDTMIHTVLVAPYGKPLDAPIVSLNGKEGLEISFDDFKATYQDYYYTVELADSAWNPLGINDFEYINGFNQNKISQYSISSISAQAYYHYQFSIPNTYCNPKLSGNYILKVYQDNDQKKVIFTNRFYVVDNIVGIYATVQVPFDGDYARTHQQLKISVDTKNIANFQNNQLTIQVIQNNRYNDSKQVKVPNFIKGNVLEFDNQAALLFPGGNEYRWLDVQSLRLRSDRMALIDQAANPTKIIMKPDYSRLDLLYTNYRDLNGGYLISNTDGVQSDNQNEYAQVIFTYVPTDNIPFLDKKLYLSGALTNNRLDQAAEMRFDVKKGAYQKSLLLKQGYYSYAYILRDRTDPNDLDDFMETEGNHIETENKYTILIYYHPLGSNYDQLLGYTTVNTLF
jgi:hypothetical protein